MENFEAGVEVVVKVVWRAVFRLCGGGVEAVWRL
jgi:hypothetical protein